MTTIFVVKWKRIWGASEKSNGNKSIFQKIYTYWINDIIMNVAIIYIHKDERQIRSFSYSFSKRKKKLKKETFAKKMYTSCIKCLERRASLVLLNYRNPCDLDEENTHIYCIL